MEIHYITEEGLKKLKEELDNLYREKAEINKEIEETRQQGDLSENAGYQYAKEKQNMLFMKINKIENIIKNARIIDKNSINKDEIRIGAKVKILDLTSNLEKNYTIVSAVEADPINNKISVNSPLAQGLLGYKINDIITVKLPSGEKKFKILSIEY